MSTSYNTDDLTRALATAAQAFLDALPTDGDASTPPPPGGFYVAGEAIRYDPLVDEAPFPVNPVGTAQEKKMTSLAYLGGIARINAERRRGANSAEVSELAKRAGYPDGRAVSGWNSRSGSERVIENVDGARILNRSGHKYVASLAADLNIELVGDLRPIEIA